MYNLSENIVLIQPSLIVKLLSNGKRTSKNTFFLRGTRTNIPCWIPNYLSVCKIAATQVFLSTQSEPFPPQYIFPLVRPSFVPFLLHNSWNRTIGSPDLHEIQWTDSGANGITQVARHKGNEGLHTEHDPERPGTNRKSTRHNQTENISISQYGYFCHTGLRFQCPDSLREPGTGGSRLQPLQTWQKVVPSVIRFREPSFNKPCRGIKARKTERQRSSHTLNKSSLTKDTCHYRYVQNAGQGGRRFLLLANNQVLRRKPLWFCHSSASNRADKEEVAGFALQGFQPSVQTGNCRVPVSTAWLGKEPPFYSDAVSPAARTGNQPADTIKDGSLRIPCVCNKPGLRPGICLVFLQRPGCCGNKYQRTENGFLYEQNSNKNILCQPCTLETVTAGFRFIPLVSDVMFTGKSSIQNFTMDSAQYSCGSSEIYYARTPEYIEIPEKSPKRKTVKTDISKSVKSKVIAKIGQFANELKYRSDETIGKNAVFPHFIG